MSNPSKPNILLVVPDGMQAGTVFPDSQCHTPNFDRLAARGVRFKRAHTSSPTCSPARASLMTGLLPHNHGVLEVEHGKDDDQCVLRTDKPHWAQRLVENGYRTGYFGKWHIERTDKLDAFGWQEFVCKDGKFMRNLGTGSEGPQPEIDPEFSRHVESPEGYNRILHYAAVDLGPEDRYPGVSLRHTQEFLTKSIESGDPWACCISFSEPNEALIAGREALSHYNVDEIKLPANLRDDYSNRPNLYRRVQGVFENVTDQEWREALACYYARITELDSIFGKIYDQLEAAGQLDNTIIIMAADHGRYVGSHGFDAHNFGPFEEIYRVPMIVSGPGIAKGEESDALVGFHDLCPTLLELTGSQPI
ncbi:MAG: arylsulfatase A-like enzyme, partial [Limisphaerales bacterium]